MPWLETLDVKVIRNTLENCKIEISNKLEANDIYL